ncbi:MAG: lipoprotein [Gammaproteobacteria bacterium]|nr:lipoprotein [Gammaproteobacteria bacterium]
MLIALALSLVATCGQKGPLYLPGEESALAPAEPRQRAI